jgi:hypothetical protein
MGISRLIPVIPREFKLGETWVALAHRKTFTRKVVRDEQKQLIKSK